jgi:GT2 family glycosyltransferase
MFKTAPATTGPSLLAYPKFLSPRTDPEQETQPPRVSAVVVSHNRADRLRRCLESLEESEEREKLEIIVVDNGSPAASGARDAEFPQGRVLPPPTKPRLTKAWNIGWRAAGAEYVLFLHDDAEVEPPAARLLADTLDANPDAAAVCPLLIDEQGLPAAQLGDLPPDGEYRPAEVSGTGPEHVRYPRGAALMIRVFVIKAVRQIDEHYGQFGADADLAAQIWRASKKILLVPAARSRHAGDRRPSAAESADFQIGRGVFLSKYAGYAAGLKAKAGAAFGALFSFRFGEFSNLLAGQKIDGSQQ